jgi:DNA-binding NtrC family response regulator
MTVRVLHVDDDPSFTRLSEVSLGERNEGIQLTTATSASDAIDRLSRRPYDCVVSDYVTAPDGEAFLETVHERHPDTPLIFLSGKALDELPDQTLRAYLTDYIRKSPDEELFDDLADRIYRHATGSRLRGRFFGEADGDVTARSIDPAGDLIVQLLEAVADHGDGDASELPSLFSTVDPDALRSLLASTDGGDSEMELRFRYDGRDVLLTGERTVFVRDAGDR